jgi:hypothetical protein
VQCYLLKTIQAGIVNENLVQHFADEVQYTEAKFFYGFQKAIENNTPKHSSSKFIGDQFLTSQ